MRDVAIVGTGQTTYARRRTDVSQAGLVREAVDNALADAELTFDDIDSIVVASGPALFGAVNQRSGWSTASAAG
jgi:acetyl-CoA C-acetyltransferase